ncbi:hypothetical protein PanWU01x14_075010 [Parasponia andersonii]|uniref:Uncharacterized protein n=1 Tax=Parasponia andersonii TaxID=3476 RepID=A0A2P5DCP5_PARAD|nr:hypothetical protein PanWU01x14_075010 [Parasponia andersonii]
MVNPSVLGFALDWFGIRVNKALYTFSYMCATAGAAGVFFVAIYVMVDVLGYKHAVAALDWIGKHSLMIYVLVACNMLPFLLQGLYWM